MAWRSIHHLGVAVENLDDAVSTYERLLGAELEGRDEGEGLRAANVLVGESRIELLEAQHDETPIAKFIAKRGPGVHHVAYAVDDIDAELEALRAGGAQLIDERARPGLFGHQIAFTHPDAVHGVLTELVANE